MLTLTEVLVNSLTPILVVIIGILTFSRLSPFYRILFFQTAIFLIFDLYASTFPNNALVYNVSMLIEIGLLLLASYLYFKTFVSKWTAITGYSVFLLIWCFDMYHYNKNQLADHAYISGGIFITATYIRILFYHYTNKNDNYLTPPLLLSCLGIFIFFAGIVPYLSMMHYLQSKDEDLNTIVFQYMMVYPAIIRYFLLAVAFLLLRRSRPLTLDTTA